MPYTALTMLLTPSPPERDSATAYRECGRRERGGALPRGPQTRPPKRALCPGMTLEMAGTLLGAAAHGLIVSGAHGPHRCEDAEFPGPGAVSPNAVSARAPRPPTRPSAGASP